MSYISYLFVFWLPFLIPTVPAVAACWFFGRRRVTWHRWELAILVVPYLLWWVLVLVECKGKSLSNAAAEPFYLGCGVTLACVARVAVGKKWKESTVATVLFTGCCLLAIAVWAFVPTMPE